MLNNVNFFLFNSFEFNYFQKKGAKLYKNVVKVYLCATMHNDVFYLS